MRDGGGDGSGQGGIGLFSFARCIWLYVGSSNHFAKGKNKFKIKMTFLTAYIKVNATFHHTAAVFSKVHGIPGHLQSKDKFVEEGGRLT